MTTKEKEILKKMESYHKGLLSEVELFNCLGKGECNKEIHKLITIGYIEEIPVKWFGKNYTGYRLTEKGYYPNDLIWNKFWHLIKSDLKTIIVSVITTALALIINNSLK